jgi:hypothetical protein
MDCGAVLYPDRRVDSYTSLSRRTGRSIPTESCERLRMLVMAERSLELVFLEASALEISKNQSECNKLFHMIFIH